MIDDFLTRAEDLPPVRPRRRADAQRTESARAAAPQETAAPRAAFAASVALAVSMLGAAPLPAGPSTTKTPAQTEGTR